MHARRKLTFVLDAGHDCTPTVSKFAKTKELKTRKIYRQNNNQLLPEPEFRLLCEKKDYISQL